MDNDANHCQSSALAFLDDHDTQPHGIDASTSTLPGTFLDPSIFFFFMPAFSDNCHLLHQQNRTNLGCRGMVL